MKLGLFFKDFGEGCASHIRPGIRWTRVIISQSQKQTITISKSFVCVKLSKQI